ncbi:MAG: methyltransferase domain-containing protein, partial [Bacteroidota bacterium]
MHKVETDFVKAQYRSGLESYTKLTKTIGLWESENYAFQKYLSTTDHILDLGCGTGRTTFPLHQLGYHNILGVDLTPEMIDMAIQLNSHFGTAIPFQVGDATTLDFPKASFEVVIFSFNGLMSIPDSAKRDQAVKEINRVLKEKGIFIFTTHDRAQEPDFFDFWKEEEAKWKAGKQNPFLREFGDIIAHSKNETREIFIHI